MKCDILTCINNDDCAILDITNKKPKDWRSCSYFKSKNKEKVDDTEKPKRRKRRSKNV